MKYSIIVPVFNRPDEVDELLESLCSQTVKDFEVIIVEDGSKKPCKDVCDKYASILDLHYYLKEKSRNYGVERAHGDYVIILDSDVVLPDGYMEATEKELTANIQKPIAAWGGPDAAHPSFTPVQKAISYSMTSFFTTGGIRGGKKKLDKFFPRSFNMGIRRDEKISTFPTASLRLVISRSCFQMRGCGISAVPTSVSSFVRYITAALPASIWRSVTQAP